MTQKTKDWDINDSQFPRLQVDIPQYDIKLISLQLKKTTIVISSK